LGITKYTVYIYVYIIYTVLANPRYIGYMVMICNLGFWVWKCAVAQAVENADANFAYK